CLLAPTGGGATPVADASTVLHALPPELVERFERSGWLLIRNYNEDIGASLADAFGTDDRRAIESYCRANAITFEWQEGGGGGGGGGGHVARGSAAAPSCVTRPLAGGAGSTRSHF